MEKIKKRLLHLLHKKSYRYSEFPLFTLSSGRQSPFYIDCKPTMHDPRGKALIGEIVYDKIKNLRIEGVGGLTMGADPIAISTSLISSQKGKGIKSFSIRKAAKGHGTAKRIEGEMQPGERVVIVDDVITSGNSVIEAIKAARDYGLKVIKVIILVDREEQEGKQQIEKLVPDVEAIFTVSDLKRFETNGKNSSRRSLSRPTEPAHPIL
ncbi:MAG: orotate phosphoribosyltransferase [Thermodesulfobacteriota bacterium]